MAKNDWYEAGEQIRKLVQDAVDNSDFSQLGTTISNIVNDTVNGLQSSLKENLSRNSRGGAQAGTHDFQSGAQAGTNGSGSSAQAGTNGSGSGAQTGTNGSGGDARTSGERTNRAAADRIRRDIEERRRRQAQERATQAGVPAKTSVKVPGELAAKAAKWFGYGMGCIMGVSLAIVAALWIGTGLNLIAPAVLLGGLTAAGFGIGLYGAGRLGMARRFRRYQEFIGDRKFCQIEELASAVGRSAGFVRRDLSRMIELGFFREGYLDRGKKTLITDRATYQQYLTTQTEYEHRKQGDAQRQEDAGQTDGKARELTPECRELIEEGGRYIRHVHECNEKIGDPEMSAKLDRLELVTTRIFREAEKDPELVGDLKKMMSYYLPTTRKLLDAYCEMDEQPVRGQNIESTKKEIESALDTINTAFENLLDSFFQDTAWDISSDITVLNTVFAQEGLTGKAFEQKQGGKKDE